MKEEIVRIQRDALARIAQASDRRGVEDARVAILGKKGELTPGPDGHEGRSQRGKARRRPVA